MTHQFEIALNHFNIEPPADIADHRARVAEADALVRQLQEQAPPDPYAANPGGLAKSVATLVTYKL